MGKNGCDVTTCSNKQDSQPPHPAIKGIKQQPNANVAEGGEGP